MLGVFLVSQFILFHKHLKVGPCNGILSATLALSRVGSDASYTVIPIWRGIFSSKYAPFLHSLKNVTKLERHLCTLHVRLL